VPLAAKQRQGAKNSVTGNSEELKQQGPWQASNMGYGFDFDISGSFVDLNDQRGVLRYHRLSLPF